MAKDLVKGPGRKRGRPPQEEVRADCRRISSFLASGFSPGEIRHEMKLTLRQYRYRMRLMRIRSYDAKEVWPKYIAKAETRYRQYEGIRQKALQKNDLGTALRAVESLKRLDLEVIQVGQDLGQYEKEARKSEVLVRNAPTLGMFHEAHPEEDGVTPEKVDPTLH